MPVLGLAGGRRVHHQLSAIGDRSTIGNRDNSPKQRALMLDERVLDKASVIHPATGLPV